MTPYPELFSGLLLVLDEPGRHGLMQGQGGDYVWKILGLSGLTSLHVGVTTLDDFAFAGPREDVRVVVFLGPKGFTRYYPDSTVKLGQAHGYPWQHGLATAIASFHPTEAYDRTKQFSIDADDEDPEEPEEAKSSKGTTRRKNYRFWLGQDLRKACRMLPLNGVLPTTDYSIVSYQPLAEVLTALDGARDKQMFFDIETDSQLRITCFSFRYSDSPTTFAVPMFVSYLKEYFHGLENSTKILWALQRAFRFNTVVVHNCLFDLFVTTWRYGLVPPLRVYDTMLSHARLFPEVEKSLGRCVSLYTDYMPYHKNEGVFEPFNQAQYDSLLQYNAKDVSSLAEVWCGIENLTVGLKAQDSVKQINAAVIPYLLAMVQGLKLDSTVLVKLTTEAARKKVQLQRILNLAVGYKLNPNSPKQVAEYVYSPHFGIPQPDLDPTNEKTLLKVQLKAKNPAITTMLAMRGLSKQLGKLKLNFYAPTPLVRVSELNGRLTTGYKLAGTTTYRLASAKLLGRWGDNIQNFDKKLRKIVVPDTGKCFVQVDQSGAEALVVAYLCRRARFRQMFEVGIKSHVYVALHLFIEAWEAHLGKKLSDLLNLPLDQLKAHSDWPELARAIADSDDWPGEKRYYALAKMVCHAANYGMKAPTFRMNVLQKSEGAVALDSKQAFAFLAGYHSLFPELIAWHNDTIQTVLTTRTLHNLQGYPRTFTGHLDVSQQKEWFAFVPQSTVGTITNKTFTKVYATILNFPEFRDVDILENTHDSVLVQCPREQAQAVGRMVVAHMAQTLTTPRGESFTMKSEASVGENWYNMEKLKL